MIFFSGFTEEEREFSQNAILRQQQANHTDTHEDIDEEDEMDLDDTGHGKDNFDFAFLLQVISFQIIYFSLLIRFDTKTNKASRQYCPKHNLRAILSCRSLQPQLVRNS